MKIAFFHFEIINSKLAKMLILLSKIHQYYQHVYKKYKR